MMQNYVQNIDFNLDKPIIQILWVDFLSQHTKTSYLYKIFKNYTRISSFQSNITN